MANSEIKMSMSLATAKVTTALGKLKTNISNFATSANEKLGSLAKMAGAGLAAAFTVSAKSALEYGKEIKNLADLSDATVEEFQRVAVAAKTVGIEQDKLADQFKDFGERVGQMVRGEGGELKPFFEGIGKDAGITAEAMAALSGPKAFGLFYRTLEEAGVRGEALSSYLEDVGSDMTALVPIYKDNAKVLNELGDAAEKNGLIMSTATAEALAKSQIAIDNFKQKAVIYVGDIISGKGDYAALKELGARFGALMAKVGEWLANGFLGAAKELTAVLGASIIFVGDKLKDGFMAAGLQLKILVSSAVNELIDGLNNLPGIKLESIDIGDTQEKLDNLLNKPSKDWSKLRSEIKDGMGDWSVSTQDAQDAFNELGDTYGSIAKTAGVVEASIKKQKEDKEELARAAEAAAAAAERQEAEERKMAETVRLQKELKEAIASGDVDRVKAAEDALKREQDILKVVDDQGVSYNEAATYIDNIIAKEDERSKKKREQAAEEEAQAEKMLGMERDLLDAVLSGDEMAARAAQKKIDLEQRAQQIMQDLKVDYQEAYEIAKKLAAIEAGPDLNDSGFTTRFEQREFDRQQKERQKILDKGLAAEERDQRERGGNIRNVTAERSDTGTVRERAAAAKELREQRKANQRINRERDPEARKAMIEAEDKRRADVQEALKPKVGGPPLGPDGKPVGPGGNHIGPDGKMVGPNGQPLDPNGPGGGGGGGPAEPKKPANAVVDGLKPTLEDIKGELVKIEKHLQC